MLVSLPSLSNIAGNNMARQIRKKSGTGIYHVMLRGINRQDIFEDDEDYLQMIACLRGLTERYDENGVVHSQVNERLWCRSPTTVKTNRRFIWSCSEIDKMITRTVPMIYIPKLKPSTLYTSNKMLGFFNIGTSYTQRYFPSG